VAHGRSSHDPPRSREFKRVGSHGLPVTDSWPLPIPGCGLLKRPCMLPQAPAAARDYRIEDPANEVGALDVRPARITTSSFVEFFRIHLTGRELITILMRQSKSALFDNPFASRTGRCIGMQHGATSAKSTASSDHAGPRVTDLSHGFRLHELTRAPTRNTAQQFICCEMHRSGRGQKLAQNARERCCARGNHVPITKQQAESNATRRNYCGGSILTTCVFTPRRTSSTTASWGLSLRKISYWDLNWSKPSTGV
jgi:hypothetical protein